MKPTNLNKETCNPISSNCVIWQGPDIACINLCKGDSVSDVVAKLATELCTVLDILNVENYDLSCFNITSCGPSNFELLIQFIIDKICELENITPSPDPGNKGCPDCLVTVSPCKDANGDFVFVDDLGQTAQLLDYVQAIAAKICTLVLQVGAIEATLVDYGDRISELESYFPLPAPTEVEIVPEACIGIPPVDTPVSVVLSALSVAFCQLVGATGTTAELINAYLSQCVTDGDLRKDGGGTMSTLPGWFSAPVLNVAESITNLWLTTCDLRNAPVVSLAVTDTQSVDLTLSAGPAYTLSAAVVDTGWVDLLGFGYYQGSLATQKPQCRRIGNVIYFRGVVTIPLSSTADGATLVPYTTTTLYNGQAVPYTYGDLTGTLPNGTLLDANGAVIFNNNANCIPTSVWNGALDNLYGLGWVVATRQINVNITYGAGLSATLSVSIDSGGLLRAAVVKDLELSQPRPNGMRGTSQLRLINTNIRAGEVIPNFIDNDTDIHNLPAAGISPLVASSQFTAQGGLPVASLTWPFSCDTGEETQLGGFQFRLDTLTAFIAP
jgi:hypothetical protein